MTEEQLKELIINKAPKFYEEFIKKGIRIYRGGNGSTSPVRIVKTNPKRDQKGNTLNRQTSVIINELLKDSNIPNRRDNVVFGISNDFGKIKLPVYSLFWLIPLGDYKFAYLKDLSSDFNYMLDKTFFEALLKLKQLSYETSVTSIYKYLSSPDEHINIPSDAHVNDELQYLLQFTHKFLNIDVLPNYFETEKVEPLRNNSVEVWFNCKSYLLVDIAEYNIEEIFKEYYGK